MISGAGLRRPASAPGSGRLRALPRRAARSGHHRPRGLPRAGERRRRPPPDRQPATTVGVATAAGRPGLLVVGDALCSFNPIYGQGITVAALQAEALGRLAERGPRIDHRLQRRLRSITDLPWSIATSNDLRFTDAASPIAVDGQRLSCRLHDRMARLAAAGNARATRRLQRRLPPDGVPGRFPAPRPAARRRADRCRRLDCPAPPCSTSSVGLVGSSHRRPQQTLDVIQGVGLRRLLVRAVAEHPGEPQRHATRDSGSTAADRRRRSPPRWSVCTWTVC